MDVDQLPSRAQLHASRTAAIPPRLLASWRRSEGYGVPLDGVQPVFSGSVDDESVFAVCGHDVLTDLRATLGGEPVSIMLTDADGLVLNRVSGDDDLLRSLDRVNLAPGFSYSERDAGTNGLGLALADRVPSLVRADDHYSLSLCGYTCAAAPVFDPETGRLEGAVNLTTWSDARSGLLLALAQTAATATANLMLARSHGRRPRQSTRGQVFRIEALRSPGEGAPRLSEVWESALAQATAALSRGGVVAAVGERGTGRATLLAQAERRANPRGHLLAVRTPAPDDVENWLSLWTPELRRAETGFVLCDADDLPAASAQKLLAQLSAARTSVHGTYALSAETFDAIPGPLAAFVDTIVHVPPLRERAADVLPLAHHLAHRVRGRSVSIAASAARVLTDYAWPGNVAELATVMRDAAMRTDAIEARHLPAQLLSHAEHLPRIRAFERDELVRVLSRPGTSVDDAAAELGMSRATVYRRLRVYGIRLSDILR